MNTMDEYWVPEHVKNYLRKLDFTLPLKGMEGHIRAWDDWMGARRDLTFDAFINEVDLSEMRMFLSDVIFGKESASYAKTVTEVSLITRRSCATSRDTRIRSRARREHLARCFMAVSRHLGENTPDEERARITFSDSVIQDTDTEKQRSMRTSGRTR